MITHATAADVPQMLKIYEPYVKNTGITFEYQVPTKKEFESRLTQTQAQFPWLVYKQNGQVLGYAYAHQYASRQAFAWSCELSVYLDERATGQGIGKKLYTYLLDLLRAQGVKTVYALIATPQSGSVDFHTAMGFEKLATFEQIGYKLGQWWGLCYMSKQLASIDGPPKEIVHYRDLTK